MQITATLPPPRVTTTPPAPQTAPAPPPAYDSIDRVATGVGRVTGGAIAGLTGLLANACAGGARGIVRGARLSDGQDADGVFQAGFAANLMLLGGAVYGAASALATLVAGMQAWKHQEAEVKARVFSTVDRYVDRAVTQLPPSDTTARRVMHGAVGEAVGIVAGAVVGAEAGYRVGAEAGERAGRFVSRKVRQALA